MEDNKENGVVINNLLDVRAAFDSKQLIVNITQMIKSGNVGALEGWTILKRMSKVSEEVMKDEEIKKMAFAELEKYSGELKGGKKSVEIYSAAISISPTHTYYDFTECGHEEWDELNKILAVVKERMGQLEEEMKTIPSPDNQKASEFGLFNEGRETIFKSLPTLTWTECFSTGNVKAPRKVQTIGMRFNKV